MLTSARDLACSFSLLPVLRLYNAVVSSVTRLHRFKPYGLPVSSCIPRIDRRPPKWNVEDRQSTKLCTRIQFVPHREYSVRREDQSVNTACNLAGIASLQIL